LLLLLLPLLLPLTLSLSWGGVVFVVVIPCDP
jgi:hypothetical protein